MCEMKGQEFESGASKKSVKRRHTAVNALARGGSAMALHCLLDDIDERRASSTFNLEQKIMSVVI